MSLGDVDGVVIAVTDKAAAVTGSVTDLRGNPVKEAAVVIFPVTASMWSHFGFSPPRIKAVSIFGTPDFRVDGLPEGEYYAIALDVSLVDDWQRPSFYPWAASRAARIDLRLGERRVLNLQLTGAAPR